MASPFAELRKIQKERIDEQPEEILVNEKITELYGWTAQTLREPVSVDNYGEPILDKVGQYFRELHAYRQGGMAGHDKLFHMVNAIKLDNPEFQFESNGYINSGALRVLKACCEHSDLGIAGSASAGKTFPVAEYILQDWKSAPNCTLSFVCTTSMSASDDRIWGAIVKLFQSSLHPIGTYIPHKSVITWGKFSDSASDRDFNSAIKALAIEQGKEGKKAIDTLRGRKQLNVRLVFDELPEMELYVTQGAINLESNTADPNNNAFGLQVIGIGNPNDPNDAHGQMCKPDHPLGFKSITKDTREWKTRTGHAIFLNGEWCANFEAKIDEPIPFPRLTNRVGIAAMLKRCYGKKNSLQYWRNAIGFWPDASVIQTVMSEELLNTSHAFDTVLWNTARRKILCGFDTGFTAGGDKCVAQFGEFGGDANGRKILQWGAEKIYMIERGGVFEDQLAEALVNDCIHFGVQPENLGMDISGDGGKIYRAIVRYWNSVNRSVRAEEVFAISSMGAASDRIVSQVDPRLCSDAFDRRVTEYWMMAREGILCEVIKGLPKEGENPGELHPIVSQLCSRIYTIKNKKMCVETKDDMKLRTLGVSPDNADAFTYLVEMARKAGLVFTTPSEKKRQDERRKVELHQSRQLVTQGNYESDSWGED